MSEFSGVVLDVDGTLIRGSEPIPGAIEAVERIRSAGLPVAFVSNNPIRTREAYRDRLASHGFSLEASELITAGTVTADHLAREHGEDSLYVIGEDGLREQLREAGLSITEACDRADVLVASIDREFDYDELTRALWTLSDPGVRFVGTDPDRTIPTEDREVPGSGAIINAVAGVTGCEPDAIMGKPAPTAIEALERTLGIDADDCLVVGDRLDTDIAMGERAGMTTALVRTGVTDERTLAASGIAPDHVLESIVELGRLL
jgi:4-nitrophenyl phosphatase